MNPIFIEDADFNNLQNFLDTVKANKIFVLTDENTHKFCFPQIEPIVSKYDFEVIEIPSGEIHKNIQSCQLIWARMLSGNASRNSLLINLGGGVISDMGGFVASVFKRGLPFINIPTTLLAAVDASYGGKTGVDFRAFKNQLGVFSNPQANFIFVDFFKSLEIRQIKTGFAEMLKHGLIADKSYWEKLTQIEEFENVDWANLIEMSIQIKNDFVKQDPNEKGIRKMLNFGHTFGHAFESFSLEHHDIPLLHGESVALGIMAELELSEKKLNFSHEDAVAIKSFLSKVFPIRKFFKENIDELIDFMTADKKNNNNDINFTLLESIGNGKIDQYCSILETRTILETFLDREIE